MAARVWSPEEEGVVATFAPQGPEAVRDALLSAGYERSHGAVYQRLSLRGLLPSRRLQAASPAPMPLEQLPTHSPSIGRQLFDLAESADRQPLTLAEYERRKAEILANQ